MRHVPKNKLRLDGETEAVVGILPQAFELRSGTPEKAPEEYLSCWSLEHFGDNRPGNTFQCIKNARRKRQPKKKDAYAFVNVGALKALCAQHSLNVRLSHEPHAGDPAYATVRDYRGNNPALREAIAAHAWSGLVFNAEVPPS